MQFQQVVVTSQRVRATRSRREKIAALTDLLRAAADDVELVVHYLTGSLPQGRIGLGVNAVRAAVTAPAYAHATLDLAAVDRVFAAIARERGAGSQQRRADLLSGLFARATRDEREFLLRLISGELRQGALAGLMVDAIAQAAAVDCALVRRAAMLRGDLAVTAALAFSGGAAALASLRLQPLRAIEPMLAQPATDVAAAIREWGTAVLDYKIDGARVQVHKVGTEVRVFTRALLDVSAAVPEIVAAARALPAASAVLDGEAIALKADRTPHPFQVTMRRFGRKHVDAAQRAALPLSVLFFDCLHCDGADLLHQPTLARAAVLTRIVPVAMQTPRLVTDDVAAAEAFFAAALAAGHEGVMAKSPSAPYEAGQRGGAWRKIKRAHTLDLVVLAAEWGNGRRRGWLSNLHLGARDPVAGEFVMLGKTFKGMTDAMLAWQTQKLQALAYARDGAIVYVQPTLVVEVAFNEIQASPIYPAGLALRFARVKRYREDKFARDADTIDTVRALFVAQGARSDRA